MTIEQELLVIEDIAKGLGKGAQSQRLKEATKAIRYSVVSLFANRASERDELYQVAVNEYAAKPFDSLDRAIAAAVMRFLGNRDCMLPADRESFAKDLGVSYTDIDKYLSRIK